MVRDAVTYGEVSASWQTAGADVAISDVAADGSISAAAQHALAAVPGVADVHLACPNKHYVPFNFEPFGLDGGNQVFVATDEPHGQIECRVGRG